jgi:parallel beta-helix repeat protein
MSLRSPRPALAGAVLLGIAATPALAVDQYVGPTGSGTACTLAQPCRQIRDALAHYPATLQAGDTIFVADGSYLGFDVDDVHGLPGQPITIQAQGSGAVVTVTTDRPDNRDTIFVTFSSWIVVDGLTAFGANRAAVRVDASPNVTVRNGVFGNNTRWGIFTDFADDLLIENNECYGSMNEHGIYVSNSGDRPVVRGNRLHDNVAAGVQFERGPERRR